MCDILMQLNGISSAGTGLRCEVFTQYYGILCSPHKYCTPYRYRTENKTKTVLLDLERKQLTLPCYFES